MSEITLNPDQLKEILKSAIVELVRDNRQSLIFWQKLLKMWQWNGRSQREKQQN